MAKKQINLNNTAKALDLYAKEVIKRAKRNLKISKKIDNKNRVTENTGSLGKSLAYKLTRGQSTINLKFVSSVKYAEFIEQGVKGSKSSKKAPKSPFKFKGKNVAEGVIEKWIRSPKIKLRNKDGQFIKKSDSNIKSSAYLIGRSIATKGISPREFMKDAIRETKSRFAVNLKDGLLKDLRNSIKIS